MSINFFINILMAMTTFLEVPRQHAHCARKQADGIKYYLNTKAMVWKILKCIVFSLGGQGSSKSVYMRQLVTRQIFHEQYIIIYFLLCSHKNFGFLFGRKAAEEMSLQPTSLMLKYLQVSSLF
jgi:hypothetical protein